MKSARTEKFFRAGKSGRKTSETKIRNYLCSFLSPSRSQSGQRFKTINLCAATATTTPISDLGEGNSDSKPNASGQSKRKQKLKPQTDAPEPRRAIRCTEARLRSYWPVRFVALPRRKGFSTYSDFASMKERAKEETNIKLYH